MPTVQKAQVDIGRAVDEALAAYQPTDLSLRLAAHTMLSMGFGGYPVSFAHSQEGYCPNDDLSYDPSRLPENDRRCIAASAANVLRSHGFHEYADKVEEFLSTDLTAFQPGRMHYHEADPNHN